MVPDYAQQMASALAEVLDATAADLLSDEYGALNELATNRD
jgi:hypothetical protein